MIDIKDLGDLMTELRTILSSTNGVKSLNESFILSYVVETETEEERKNVEKVADLLANQAQKYGFSLEVTAVTSKDIAQAKEKFAEHIAKQSGFKA